MSEPERYRGRSCGPQRYAETPTVTAETPTPHVDAAIAATEGNRQAVNALTKPPKPAKPAPPPKAISPLGLYHPATEAAKLWQAKGPVKELQQHLANHPGTGYVKSPAVYDDGPRKGEIRDEWKDKQVGKNLWLQPNGHAEATGLHAMLSDKPHVTRDEVLAHLAKADTPLSETVQGGNRPKTWRLKSDDGRDAGKEFASEEEAAKHLQEKIEKEIRMQYSENDPEQRERIEDEMRDKWTVHENDPIDDDTKNRTHFDKYQLPGPKDGYRELHVTAPDVHANGGHLLGKLQPHVGEDDYRAVERPIPGNPSKKQVEIINKNGAGVAIFDAPHDMDANRYRDAYITQANKKIDAANAKAKRSEDWNDGHTEYDHVKNPVVRVRHNDRFDVDGNKTKVIEEIQGPSPEEQEKMPPHLRERIYDIGIKRMLTMAVEGGYDKLAWTTGEQQKERYNLAKHVDELRWHPVENGDYGRLIGVKDGKHLFTQLIPSKELNDYVGNEIASNLSQVGGYPNVGSVKGDDLSVGGHGLASVYDQMLPNKFGKIVKKSGGKIETTEVPDESRKVSHIGNGKYALVDRKNMRQIPGTPTFDKPSEAEHWNEENPAKQALHSLTITPEIAKLVREGFSQYARVGDPMRYAAARAPAGGVTIGGQRYAGGQWIHGDAVANASPDVKAKITRAANTRKAARGERSVDHADLTKRLAPHAKPLTPAETKAANRSLAALRDHHGDLTVHRLDELAEAVSKAHGEATGMVKESLGKKLSQLAYMTGKVGEQSQEKTLRQSDAFNGKPKVKGAESSVDMKALDAKLKRFKTATIPLSQNDMRFAIAGYHQLKKDYGELAQHKLAEMADHHLAMIEHLPINASDTIAHHEKNLAVTAWMSDQLKREGVTGDVDDPKLADMGKNLDRIRLGERSRGGKHASPWVAFLVKALLDTDVAREGTSPAQVFENLKAGQYRNHRDFPAALRMLGQDYGTLTPKQFDTILPKLKSIRDTIPEA